MIHPHIKRLIDLLKDNGYIEFSKESILFLISQRATSTQTTFVFLQGFKMSIDDINEKLKEYLHLFKNELASDTIYETLLYDGYDPDEKKFKADENYIRFSLKGNEDELKKDKKENL